MLNPLTVFLAAILNPPDRDAKKAKPFKMPALKTAPPPKMKRGLKAARRAKRKAQSRARMRQLFRR